MSKYISIQQSIISKSHIVCVSTAMDPEGDDPSKPFTIEISLDIPDTDLSLEVFAFKTKEQQAAEFIKIAEQLAKE